MSEGDMTSPIWRAMQPRTRQWYCPNCMEYVRAIEIEHAGVMGGGVLAIPTSGVCPECRSPCELHGIDDE